MKNKFINHSIKNISEANNERALAVAAVESTRKHVEDVAEEIRKHEGDDVVENVLCYKQVIRALEQCKKYAENSDNSITFEDHYIYYDFLYRALERAERIIDEEMSEYGF